MDGPDLPMDCFGDPHVVVIEVVDGLTWKWLHRDREGRVLRYADARERHIAPSAAMVPAEPPLAAAAEAWEAAQADSDSTPGGD